MSTVAAAAAMYSASHSEYKFDNTTHRPTTVNTAIGHINNQFLNRPNLQVEKIEVMPTYGGGSEKCARCSKTVYAAEKRTGAGRSFHVSCFSCQACNRKLESTTLCEHKGEIYCKTCYTREFGVHGVAHGVSVTTEAPVHKSRSSRRSSCGDELEMPARTPEPIRKRSNSNDNSLRGEHSAVQNDEISKIFPWRNEVLPNDYESRINKTIKEYVPNHDTNNARPASQIGFQHIVDPNNNDRSPVVNKNDHQERYNFDDGKTYTNRISQIIEVPTITPPNRVVSTIERIEIPLAPTNISDFTKVQSKNTTDVYQRQHSREHETSHFSPLTFDDNEQNDPVHLNDNMTPNAFIIENPLIKPTYSNSSSNVNKNNLYDEQNYFHDSPSSANVHGNRSPSSTSGYDSSNLCDESKSRGSASPSTFTVSEHNNIERQPSNTPVAVRYSESPRLNERTPSALHEFVVRTNMPAPKADERYSAISVLTEAFRPSKNNLEN